jgi:uncharacterized protein (TIGR02145 family)
MSYLQKYQNLARDRFNVLWTSNISEKASPASYVIKYGFLYNWFAVSDPRIITAPGSHIPTKDEFERLVTRLGGSAVAGGKLKEVDLIYWNDPNTGATNEFSFNARGAGVRNDETGVYSALKVSLDLWSLSFLIGPYVLEMDYDSAGTNIFVTYSRAGCSIRPVKDSTLLTEGQTGIYTGNDGKVYRTIAIATGVNGEVQEWVVDNLCETKFRNGDSLTKVTDAEAWAILDTEAYCAYDNDDTNAYTSTSSEIINLIGAGSKPLDFEMVNESDNIFDPIKSSRITLSVYSYTMFGLDDLYSSDDMYHKVEIYQEANLHWQGYVDPKQCQEPYGPVPYVAQICCIDGLTLLKNIPYEESEGVPYNGHKLESEIMLDILGKIGYTTFREFVNLYEDSMNKGIDDSPMDQLMINADVFAEMYCDEVLKQILKKYNANSRQIGGEFCIYRPVELLQSIVYGRIFTGPETKTSTSITPKQIIKRTSYDSSYVQIPQSKKLWQSPAKKVDLIQDYGNKKSWIDNYQFKVDTFTFISALLGYSTEGWIRYGAVGISPLSSLIPGETEGVIFFSQEIYPEHIRYIYQSFGINAKTTADSFNIKFEYAYYNTGETLVEDVVLYIEIKNSISTYWLHAEDTALHLPFSNSDAHWDDTQQYIRSIIDAPPGLSDWVTFERTIPGLPADGPYKISIFSLSTVTPEPLIYVAIKSVEFYTYSQAASLKSETRLVPYYRKRPWFAPLMWKPWGRMEEKEIYYFPNEPKTVIERIYTKKNNINGIELSDKFLLGDVTDADIDNVIEQFAGALIRSQATAQARVDTITLTGTSGTAHITCNGLARDATYSVSPTWTAVAFVNQWVAEYLSSADIYLSSDGPILIFTAVTAGDDFSGDTTILTLLEDLSGIVSEGSRYSYALTPTITWSKRGGVEAQQLLQIIADEIAKQYERPKQLLDLALRESTAAPTTLAMMGSFQDSINIFNGFFRAFVPNRGSFDIKYREWKLDMVEIGAGDAAGEGTEITADNVIITVDSDIITADQTHN